MSTRLLAIILFVILRSGISKATGFEIYFGGPGTQICSGMAIGNDSSIYMLGYTYNGPLGGVDFMLAKVTLQGQVLWTRYMGTSHDDFGASVVFTPDGNLLLAGTSHDPVMSEQVLLIEADTSGNEISTHFYGTIGTESVNAVKLCPDNGYLIAGYQTSSGTNYSYMLKTDSLYNEEWFGAYGIGVNDYASEGIMTGANSFFLASDRRFNTGGGNFDYDVCITHTDSSGTVVWDSVYHADFQNGSQGMIQSQGGHFLVFGETEVFQFSPFDYFIFAADTNGNLLWRQTFGGTGTNALFDLIEDSAGNLIGTGYGNSQSGGNNPINVVIVKTDPLGNLIWQYEYGLPGIDLGYIIRNSPDGGFLVAGRTTGNNDEDFYLLKTDDNGLISSTTQPEGHPKDLVVYPNPSTGNFRFHAATAYTSIRIIGISGKTSLVQTMSGHKGSIGKVSCETCSPGIYILELINGQEVVSRGLVSIQ